MNLKRQYSTVQIQGNVCRCAAWSRWVNSCVNRFLEQQLKAAASDRLSYHTGSNSTTWACGLIYTFHFPHRYDASRVCTIDLSAFGEVFNGMIVHYHCCYPLRLWLLWLFLIELYCDLWTSFCGTLIFKNDKRIAWAKEMTTGPADVFLPLKSITSLFLVLRDSGSSSLFLIVLYFQ